MVSMAKHQPSPIPFVLGIGSALAIVMAVYWCVGESIIWAIINGLFSWVNVVYQVMARGG